jgi:hypothetical protein
LEKIISDASCFAKKFTQFSKSVPEIQAFEDIKSCDFISSLVLIKYQQNAYTT